MTQDFIDLVMGEEVASYRTARDFNGMADSLNAPTERGPVPIEEVAAFCCRNGITGGVMALAEIPLGAEIAPSVPMSLQTKAMLHTVLTLIQLDYRLTTADVDDPAFEAACDGLVGLGVMSSDQKTAILALGGNRVSKAEATLGRPCTGSDCLTASGGD